MRHASCALSAIALALPRLSCHTAHCLGILLLSLLAFVPASRAADKRDWRTARVISQNISSSTAGTYAMPVGTAVIAVPIRRMSNVVVVETPHDRMTWVELGGKVIILSVNEDVRYYMDGEHFVVLDSKGKKHKFALVGMEKKTEELPKAAATQSTAIGTGFLLNQGGLIGTNWHVVSGAGKISVTFPGWQDSVEAEIVIRDVANDLAILRLKDVTKLAGTCPDLPFQLTDMKSVVLGERVSTLGYPLSPVLGSTPKFSEGVIASKNGLQDDPRSFQISAAIQPGLSGGPLFDDNGNVIGVVEATLNPGATYEATGALPQNVNWAIKADYLLNLAGMLPNEPLSHRTTPFSPEKAARCVGMITAF